MIENLLSPRWWFTRFWETLMAAAFVYLLTSWIVAREDRRFDDLPPTEWFEVFEIYVPDHEVGSNPIVGYDREIKVNFDGFWIAEVQQRNLLKGSETGFFAACSGSGTNHYETTDYLDPDLVTWEWFLGRPCVVPPGTYRIVVTYDMRRPGDTRVKRYRVLSNVFEVTP